MKNRLWILLVLALCPTFALAPFSLAESEALHGSTAAESKPVSESASPIEEELLIRYFGFRKGRLAFSYKDKSKKSSSRDIYVIDFQSLRIKPLVTSPGNDEFPRWSPDGQELLFYSDRNGNRDIYRINADGSGLLQLTDSPETDEDPDWSPDGKRVVFHSNRRGRGSELFIMDADGSQEQPIGIERHRTSSLNTLPRWSPRGDSILYATNEDWPGWDIALYDIPSKKKSILTKGYQSFTRASWHPDGGSFVFSYGAGKDVNIWQFIRGAEKLEPIIIRPGRNYDAEWTNDGQRLFFVGEQTRGKKNYRLFIWEKEADRIEQVVVAKGSIRHPSWTPLPSLESLKEIIKRRAKKGDRLP